MRFPGAAVAVAAAAFLGGAYAQCQQVVPGMYTGTEINNSLPVTHPNSEVSFFKVKDPSGEHVCTDDDDSDFTFITYSSLNSTKQRPPNSALQRVVIVIHGLRRDPQNYHAAMLQALEKVTDPAISVDSVAVLAPYFPNGNDKGVGFPYNSDGATARDRYPSPALVWSNTAYSGGAVNLYPPGRQTIPSFDAVDQMVQYYADITKFPNMKQIIVSGHSLGAQMVQRYAAVGKTAEQLGLQVPVGYWIGDPSSMVWLDSTRPLATDKCAIYDDYREGLANYQAYGSDRSQPMTYNLELVNAGAAAVRTNFEAKAIHWGRASRDFGDKSENCAPFTSGQERNERFFEFVKAFPPSCSNPAGDNCDTVDIVDSGHDAPTMFQSPAGLARLFTDNWDGDGARAYDFGYPRRTDTDDPYPDPAHANDPLINEDTHTYDGGFTYRGCFSDVDQVQSVGSLPVRAYVGSANSRTYCSNVCSGQGYKIAGVSDQYCYCGNSIGSQTAEVVSTSCGSTCPGDNTQLCGGANRLSIMANGPLRSS